MLNFGPPTTQSSKVLGWSVGYSAAYLRHRPICANQVSFIVNTAEGYAQGISLV